MALPSPFSHFSARKLTGYVSLIFLICLGFASAGQAPSRTPEKPRLGPSLVPDALSGAPDYFSTWAAQYYAAELKGPSPKQMQGSDGAKLARAELNEINLLGPNGWASKLYPDIRRYLYFIMDDSWDVPPNGDLSYMGSLELDRGRFPSIEGTPVERLRAVNEILRAAGWRGLGLWISPQEAPTVINHDQKAGIDTGTPEYRRAYWRTRLEWSEQAGIRYWKVDWGKRGDDTVFRRWLTELGQQYAPHVTIEHALPEAPLNGYGEGELPSAPDSEGLFGKDMIEKALTLLRLPAVYRIYDTFESLGIPTALDRVANLLVSGQQDPSSIAVINSEDEDYIGAVLGCSLGFMRYPMRRISDVADPRTRNPKQRLTEMVRAVRWHQIAPPFPVGALPVAVDSQVLWDDWKFEITWFTPIVGRVARQGAPARMARGLPLPGVLAHGEAPYVVVGRNPNGAVAIGTFGRMSHEKGWYFPLADVELKAVDQRKPIGIFGHYKSLAIEFDQPLKATGVWAQDLAADHATDITSQVHITGKKLVLDGDLINKVGLSAAAQDDFSDPGLILVIK
jgi:hypothetical protein